MRAQNIYRPPPRRRGDAARAKIGAQKEPPSDLSHTIDVFIALAEKARRRREGKDWGAKRAPSDLSQTTDIA